MSNRYSGHNLVFLVGCPRSGTTWLQRMLAAHPQIVTGQESGLFDTYIGPQLRSWNRDMDPKESGRGRIGLACYFSEAEFHALLRDYMERLLAPILASVGEGQLFLEKTPSHVLFIDEIRQLLPDARFIHLIRDGRDVVASLLAASRSWGERWAPKSAKSAAILWRYYVKAGLAARSSLSHESLCEVRYEELIANPHEHIRQLTAFLGLQWNDEELQQAVLANSVGHKNFSPTEIPLNGAAAELHGEVLVEPEGFVRSAQAGSWKDDLKASEKLAVWWYARDLLSELGYRS